MKNGKNFRKEITGFVLYKNMKILEYLIPERVKLNLEGKTKSEIIREMAQLFVKSGVLDSEDLEEFVKEINEREKLTPTGMQDGIAIPHARTPFVKQLSLALGISKEGIDFESMDGEPSKLTYEEELIDQMENVETIEEIFEKLKNI